MKKPLLFCGQGCGAAAVEMLTGVFLAFEEFGLEFDKFFASSGSAIFTSLYTSGHDSSWFRNLMEAKPFEEFMCLKPIQAIKSVTGASNYVYDSTGLFELLKKEMNAKASLKVMVTVTELDGMKSKQYPAMPNTTLASGSIPILIPPVRVLGKLCGDGGVGDNIPVPSVKDCSRYEHVFLFMAPPDNYAEPKNIVESALNLLTAVMNREENQMRQDGYFDKECIPNLTLIRLPSLMSGGLLHWSKNFELRSAAYQHTCELLTNLKLPYSDCWPWTMEV